MGTEASLYLEPEQDKLLRIISIRADVRSGMTKYEVTTRQGRYLLEADELLKKLRAV